MTIRSGAPWGVTVARPDAPARVGSDVELAERVAAGHRGPLAVDGGDLVRTLGGRSSGPTVQQLPIDVLRIDVDGRSFVGVGHVVARRRGPLGWWRGPIVAVMNVEALGRWDVAPRAHPNDGRADVIEVAASMTVRDRWKAWRRLRTGSHVPHPDIHVTQRPAFSVDFATPMLVVVDGVERGTGRRLRVTVDPDACVVYA